MSCFFLEGSETWGRVGVLTRIVIAYGEQAFPTSYFKKVHESYSLFLSPPQRPLFVVGRLVRKNKRVRGERWEGGRENRGLFPPPSGSLWGGERACATQARKLERKRKKLEDWRGKRGGGKEETSLPSPTSFLFFALVPTFSTYYQRAASRRGGSIIKPCAKVSRKNESRSDVT